MPALETDTLAELIRSKRACLLQLRDLGRRQVELIEAADMTALLDLLAIKQRALMKLQQIERTLDPVRGQDPEQRNWASPESRRECGEQLAQCDSLLSEIVSREKVAESALVQRRDATAKQLQGAHFAGQARQAYAAMPPEQAGQLDLLSET